MDKETAVLIVCMLLGLCFSFTVTNRDEGEDQKQNTTVATSYWLWQKLRSFYSLYSKIGSPATWQWKMLKEAYSHFISPHLGFSKGGDEGLRAAKSGNEKKTSSSNQDSQHQNEL
ncbi:hypothetical protein QN277_024455 [Acacia crassicarpa]|uniref:Uncharacterized protein n=1 Tax=Acacia crassicarpa TaxID=499986 RepID=A0AAE1K9K1_9FABA|nr:hypothetical protein QN277_024455 [Acacia crassicarpa]